MRHDDLLRSPSHIKCIVMSDNCVKAYICLLVNFSAFFLLWFDQFIWLAWSWVKESAGNKNDGRICTIFWHVLFILFRQILILEKATCTHHESYSFSNSCECFHLTKIYIVCGGRGGTSARTCVAQIKRNSVNQCAWFTNQSTQQINIMRKLMTSSVFSFNLHVNCNYYLPLDFSSTFSASSFYRFFVPHSFSLLAP